MGGAAETAAAGTGPLSRRVQLLLLAMSFAGMILASVVGVQRQADGARLRTYIDCQASVNEANALATRARSEASDTDRAADREESAATKRLILAVFTATGPDPRGQIRQAFADYETTLRDVDARRQAAEEQRRTNPLPPPPSETCRAAA